MSLRGQPAATMGLSPIWTQTLLMSGYEATKTKEQPQRIFSLMLHVYLTSVCRIIFYHNKI